MPEETFCRLLDRALEFLFKVLRVLIAVMLFFTTIAIVNSSLILKTSKERLHPCYLSHIGRIFREKSCPSLRGKIVWIRAFLYSILGDYILI